MENNYDRASQRRLQHLEDKVLGVLNRAKETTQEAELCLTMIREAKTEDKERTRNGDPTHK